MAPKSLLRHKLVVSTLDDMGPGSLFRRVLGEVDDLAGTVRRVVVCSGKVYYDLLEERRARHIDDVAVVRVEQLYPWPHTRLKKQLSRYPGAEVLWCQEEPANMGAWTFAQPRLDEILESLEENAKVARYVGRRAAASTATGQLKVHLKEQQGLIDQALAADWDELPQPFRRRT